MVRCIICPHFTRKTCHCNYYNRTVKSDDIHKQILCDGYPNPARRNWLLIAPALQAYKKAIAEAEEKLEK